VTYAPDGPSSGPERRHSVLTGRRPARDGGDGQGIAAGNHELNLVSPASTADQHDAADIAFPQSFFGKIAGQRDQIQLINRHIGYEMRKCVRATNFVSGELIARSVTNQVNHSPEPAVQGRKLPLSPVNPPQFY
jgi:hypothetical protein